MKKLLLILLMIGLIVCLFVSCAPTVPTEDEEEDEGEGEPETVNKVVLVELFTTGCPQCILVEPSLEQLAGEYSRDEMILVEEVPWASPITPGANDRYKWYLPDETDRTTPNTFINGKNPWIALVAAYSYYKSKIDLELKREAKIAITFNRESSAGITTITGTIKNLTSFTTLSNLQINGMAFKDLGESGKKYHVEKIFNEDPTEVTVSSLAPGETYNYTFTLTNISWDSNSLDGVIFVQLPNSSKKEILQSIFVD